MEKKMNLAQKISLVMSEVTTVGKKGFNEFHKYKYAKESDYLEAIRPSLIEHGVIVVPTLLTERKEGDLTTVTMKFTLINAENPTETLETVMPGQGSDKGDKGVYKAITGAKKYFVANMFLIPTNDDPENDTETDTRTAKPQAKVTHTATKVTTATKVAETTTPTASVTKNAFTSGTATKASTTPTNVSSFRKDKMNGSAATTATNGLATKPTANKGGW